MAIDKHGGRAWRAKLREVLNTTWDPIGGCPEDEYDGYVGKVASMVREGASDDAIRDYLRWAESEHMGFGRVDSARLERTLAYIRSLGSIS
jgi:hypothetical protein